jgi:RNA polymerase sigma factor (sigma-70 family)
MEAATATRTALPAELVQRASRGDAAAFSGIVAAHHADMVRVCLTVCGDPETAEEAVQAAWALAWRRLPGLRDTDRLRSWLISIAANQARDSLRRQRRRPVVELSIADGDGGSADPARRPGDIDLRNAMSRLDPADRALVALRYLGGFDSTELGGALGMSPSGTRARLARILDRLRTELRDA